MDIAKVNKVKQRLADIHDGFDFDLAYCIGYIQGLAWENIINDEELEELEEWVYAHKYV